MVRIAWHLPLHWEICEHPDNIPVLWIPARPLPINNCSNSGTLINQDISGTEASMSKMDCMTFSQRCLVILNHKVIELFLGVKGTPPVTIIDTKSDRTTIYRLNFFACQLLKLGKTFGNLTTDGDSLILG